jgi:uncharacterized protein
MPWPRLLLMLAIFTGVLALGHYYLWKRLLRDPAWPRLPRRLTLGVGGALVLSLPLTLFLARTLPRDQVAFFAFPMFLWLGVASTLFSLLLIVDIARGLVRLRSRLFRPRAEVDEQKRLFFSRALAGGVLGSGALVTAFSVHEALAELVVKRVEVTLKRLPPEFDGFRIAQVSDIHIGPTLGRPFLAGIVERVNALGANLVAITGDLVDGSVEHLSRHTAPLGELKASDGVFFVTGNHEYYSGADEWIRELERLNIPTLRNRRVSLQRGDSYLDIAGVTDHRADSFGDAPDYEAALGARDYSREVVLLAHQPVQVYEAQKYGVGLQLSGHTHGGQFWPWTWIILLVQPISRGLARVGGTQVYVNTGTGYWGPPLRSGTPPEITEIVLRCPA